MNTNVLIAVIVVIVLAAGGFFFFTAQDANAPESTEMKEEMHDDDDGHTHEDDDLHAHDEDEMTEETTGRTETEVESAETSDEESTSTEPEAGLPTSATITYTDDGYVPEDVTIAQGGTVTFVNESSRDMWPASNQHPTHTIYPGSSIQKCNTEEAEGIFDACDGLSEGATYSFTFDEVGDWKYHDHLRPREGGTISVQ